MSDPNQSGQDALVTMTEKALRSLSWGVVEARNLDGSPLFMVQGAWPGGDHAFFLPIPVDMVQEARLDGEALEE